MLNRDMVVIGASAGGVEALSTVVAGLPPKLPAAVFVVLHVSPHSPSYLPVLLDRRSALRVAHARHGELIERGRVYVAPPDHHLLVRRGYVTLSRGPRENGSRPALDPLFRSAAAEYGPRVVGVVLTGALDDGTAGLLAIKRRGGTAVVQDPETALVPSMPRHALDHVDVDRALPLDEIGPFLARIVQEPVAQLAQAPDRGMEHEVEVAERGDGADEGPDQIGRASAYSCPECHGMLREISDGTLLRYRCRVGHAYSQSSLLSEQRNALEAALWTALRALEESAALAAQLHQHAVEQGLASAAQSFAARADDANRRADVIRQVLIEGIEAAAGPAGDATKSLSADLGAITVRRADV